MFTVRDRSPRISSKYKLLDKIFDTIKYYRIFLKTLSNVCFQTLDLYVNTLFIFIYQINHITHQIEPYHMDKKQLYNLKELSPRTICECNSLIKYF